MEEFDHRTAPRSPECAGCAPWERWRLAGLQIKWAEGPAWLGKGGPQEMYIDLTEVPLANLRIRKLDDETCGRFRDRAARQEIPKRVNS